MRREVETATERVIAIRARIAGLPDDDAVIREIEDALCEGYAHALAGEAWLAESERQLHALIDDDTHPPDRGRDLRALAGERSDVEREVIALRRELEALRGEHHRMRSHAAASSA